MKLSLFQNIISLYLIHIVRLIMPLVLLPILSRRVSEETFGLYIFTISLGAWFSLFAEYGFNISGTKDLAVCKERQARINLVSSIYSAKYILLALCLPVCVIIYMFFPLANSNLFWFLSALVFSMSVAMIPTFYFQGIENTRPLALLEVFTGSCFLMFIFVFVKNESDINLIPLAIIITRLASMIVGLSLVVRRLSFRCLSFDLRAGLAALKTGRHCFVLQAMAGLYTSFNVVLLGFWVGAASVAVFGAGERLIRAGLGFIGQLSNALLPRVASVKDNAPNLFRRYRLLSLISFFVVGLFGAVATVVCSPYVVPWLLGDDFIAVVDAVKVLAWVIPAIAISNVLGFQYLLLEKKERYLNGIIAVGGALNIALACMLVPALGYMGMAWSWLAIEWLISIAMGCFVIFGQRKKLISA